MVYLHSEGERLHIDNVRRVVALHASVYVLLFLVGRLGDVDFKILNHGKINDIGSQINYVVKGFYGSLLSEKAGARVGERDEFLIFLVNQNDAEFSENLGEIIVFRICGVRFSCGNLRFERRFISVLVVVKPYGRLFCAVLADLAA